MFTEKLDQYLQGKSSNNEFSGVILVKKGNEELFARAYGYANRSWLVENSLDTRFRIGSISKMFTAISILQLVENKTINFHTSIVKYLDLATTKISEQVTIQHLLTHTSGIADYYDESSGNIGWEQLWSNRPIYKVRKLADYLPLFIYKDSIANVGESFKYNNAGYILLGLAIEKASGLSYFDYVKRNVFSIFNMKDSDFIGLDEVADRIAEGYELEKDEKGSIQGWKKNIYTATPNAASDGGAISTAYDLIHFIQSLREKKILGAEINDRMLTPQVIDEGSNGFRDYIWKYGYGNWFLLNQEDQIIRGGHTGEEYGVSCRLYYYPLHNIDVVILGNQGWSAGSIGWKIHDMIVKEGDFL